ncbi:MAG: ABC transporter substrate-binding protein [Candidatus Heimdallarchaeota archaeon]
MKKTRLIISMTLIIALMMTFSLVSTHNAKAALNNEYFFQVRILTTSDPVTGYVANFVAQELRRIRIDSQILSHPEGAFESAVVSRTFDLVLIDTDWPSFDVDPSVYFGENGAGNYWGVRTSLPYGDINEDLLLAGKIETNEAARIELYHDWQQNLMENILPVIPLYNTKLNYVTYGVLDGYDHVKGIAASLPYMEWIGTHHPGQNLSTFTNYLDDWHVLNPLHMDDDTVTSLIYEPLIRTDSNFNYEGVLTESWSFSENKTKLRLNLRHDVNWQPDIDNIYTNENFTANDVAFSLLMYNEFSTTGTYFNWIESVEIINPYTLDIYIDADPLTIGRQSYAPVLSDLNVLMLPEHYLNVSVDLNGLPDTSAPEWVKFGVFGLGTGMYTFNDHSEGVSASLKRNDYWWGTEPAAYDEDLDIATINFRFLTDLNTLELEFQAGRLDIFKDFRDHHYDVFNVVPYVINSKSDFTMNYIGFNLYSDYCPNIRDETLTEDGTMSKGLAVRKALAYLIGKDDIINFIDLDIEKTNAPISNAFGPFVKNNIISYAQNLDKAKEFMLKAGYNPTTLKNPGYTTFVTITSLFLVAIILHFTRKRKFNQRK